MKEHDESNNGYDVIGDIHGELESLKRLLKLLGYCRNDQGYYHPEGRQAVFVGDLIDRGPDSRGVLRLVRTMADAGNALVTMGNHEYHFIAYHTLKGEGKYLQPHTVESTSTVSATLKSFAGHDAEMSDFINWMKGLPFFLDLHGLRVVHASWIDAHIDYLRDKSLEDDLFLAETARHGSSAHSAIENVLNGVEIELPEGISFLTPDGFEKNKMRVRWWETLNGRTWREVGFPEREEYPLSHIKLRVEDDLIAYNRDDAPVLFGHYKLINDAPRLETPKVATLDYGAGHGGPTTAYRWDGEDRLNTNHFVQSSATSALGKARPASFGKHRILVDEAR